MSASNRAHPAFEPEWVYGTFSIRGKCENPECSQVFHGAGDFSVDFSTSSLRHDPWEVGPPPYSSYYRLTNLHPPLHLMPVPQSAPKSVQDGVLRASRVLFADPGLAATALRAVVELFLTSEGISATNASMRFRSAHSRIKEWRNKGVNRSQTADLLFAVKWLGNAGTHEDSDLTLLEVLAGAKLLDEAFHRIYTGPDIDAQAQTINVAKGPPR